MRLSLDELFTIAFKIGGPGSGNFGHSGRPGVVGGSAPRGGGSGSASRGGGGGGRSIGPPLSEIEDYLDPPRGRSYLSSAKTIVQSIQRAVEIDPTYRDVTYSIEPDIHVNFLKVKGENLKSKASVVKMLNVGLAGKGMEVKANPKRTQYLYDAQYRLRTLSGGPIGYGEVKSMFDIVKQHSPGAFGLVTKDPDWKEDLMFS